MDPAGRPAVLTKGSQPWTALAVACHVPIRTACFCAGSTTRSRSTGWGWTLVLNPDGTTTAWNKDKTKVLHSHGPPVRPG